MKHSLHHALRMLEISAYEQATLLKTRIQGRFELLDSLAAMLQFENVTDAGEILKRAERVKSAVGMKAVAYVTHDGQAMTEDGRKYYVGDRDYFHKTISGEHAAARIQSGRISGVDSFLLTVPLRDETGVRGFPMAIYEEKTFRALLMPSVYEGDAYACVIRENGDVFVAGDGQGPLASADENVFDVLAGASLEGRTAAGIREDLRMGRKGAVIISQNGTEQYGIYVPTGIDGTFMFLLADMAEVRRDLRSFASVYLTALALALALAAVMIIVTLRQERRYRFSLETEKERLRISEQEYRIASEHGKQLVLCYYLSDRRLKLNERGARERSLPPVLYDIPESALSGPVRFVASESADDFRKFFESMQKGVQEGECTVKYEYPTGLIQWRHMNYTLVRDVEGTPLYGVISTVNVTEQREKELVYERWTQSVASMPLERTAVYEYNVSRNFCDRHSGELFKSLKGLPKDESGFLTPQWILDLVHPDDAEKCLLLLNRERLIAGYYSGKREANVEYRVRFDREYHWINLTLQLVQYPDSTDIKAFIVFGDVTERKSEELAVLARSQENPLTKLLNRESFKKRVSRVLAERPLSSHALIMIDLDHFKAINDTLAHIAGDQVLLDTAHKLRALLWRDDLAARMDGDEFMLFLIDVPGDGILEKRAQLILSLLDRDLTDRVHTSGRAGIAVFPRDGESFSELYNAADLALYCSKENGRNRYAFYDPSMSGVKPESEKA